MTKNKNTFSKKILFLENIDKLTLPMKKYVHPFKLLDATLIGQGQQGNVYKTYYNGKRIALKEMSYTHSVSSNEIKILNWLTENNIDCAVKFLGFTITNENNKKYWMMMEYHPAGSLGDYSHYNFSSGYQLIYAITQSVSTLHSHGITHGDIKLNNILLDHVHYDLSESYLNFTSESQIKFCDFSFANSQWPDGTAQYMPPEIQSLRSHEPVPSLDEAKVDRYKADVYSLAITIFAIFLNVMHFQNAPEQSASISFSEDFFESHEFDHIHIKLIEHLATLAEQYPKIFLLVLWATHPEPEKRPTAEELLEQLETGLDHFSTKLISFADSRYGLFLQQKSDHPLLRTVSMEDLHVPESYKNNCFYATL